MKSKISFMIGTLLLIVGVIIDLTEVLNLFGTLNEAIIFFALGVFFIIMAVIFYYD